MHQSSPTDHTRQSQHTLCSTGDDPVVYIYIIRTIPFVNVCVWVVFFSFKCVCTLITLDIRCSTELINRIGQANNVFIQMKNVTTLMSHCWKLKRGLQVFHT